MSARPSRQAHRVWQAPPRLPRAAGLISPFNAFAPYLLDQCRGRTPQVDQIDVIRDRALLDLLRERGEKLRWQVGPRQDGDIDVAVLHYLATGAGAEQPHLSL